VAVVLADIYASFPEFALSLNIDALVTAKLTEAKAQVDYSLFENTVNADTAVKYLTARLLALSPAGLNMKLSGRDGATIYDATYMRVLRAAAFGYRVP